MVIEKVAHETLGDSDRAAYLMDTHQEEKLQTG